MFLKCFLLWKTVYTLVYGYNHETKKLDHCYLDSSDWFRFSLFAEKMHADLRVLHFIKPKSRKTLEELLRQRRMMSLKKKLLKKGDESSYSRLINRVLYTAISFDLKRVFIGLIWEKNILQILYKIRKFRLILNLYHCVKCVQIWSFFWSVFSRIRTEYGEIRNISPYSVQMRESTDQKKPRIRTLFTECFNKILEIAESPTRKNKARNLYQS